MSKRFVSLITLVAMLLCLMAPATAMAQEATPSMGALTATASENSVDLTLKFTTVTGTNAITAIGFRIYSDAALSSQEAGWNVLNGKDAVDAANGTVTSARSGLSAGTTYYVVPVYIYNGNTYTGDAVSFTTLPAAGTPASVNLGGNTISGGKITFSATTTDGNPEKVERVYFVYTVNSLNMYAVQATRNGNTWTGSMDISKMAPGTYDVKVVAETTTDTDRTDTGSFTLTQDQITEKPETIIPGVVVPGNGYYYNGYYYVPGYGYYIPGYGYVPNYPTTYYSYVITNNPTNISSANATLNGFASNGISKAGFQVRKANGNWGDTLWGSDANGAYALKVTGLKPGTAYYVRAVGIAGNGYVYGDPVAFVTTGGYVSNPAPVVPSVPTYPSYPNYTVPGGSLPGSSSGNSIPKTGVDAHYYAAAVLMMAGLALVATAKRREA